jgi:hypothetical protein
LIKSNKLAVLTQEKLKSFKEGGAPVGLAGGLDFLGLLGLFTNLVF